LGGERDFPAPAPAPPYGQTLSVHNGTDPNGTWSLYTFTDTWGQYAAQTGWTLTLTTPDPRLLSVAVGGAGSGTVTGSGINCPGACSKSYGDGTQVTLTAAPAAGSTFAGWAGDCAGTSSGSCTVTMSAARSVTANFDPAGTSPGGGGTTGGGPPSNAFTFVGGKSCGQGCLEISLPGPGTVTAADAAAGGNTRAIGSAYKKKSHKKRKPMITPVTVVVTQAGTVQLRTVPSQAGKQVLKRRHKLTVTVRITFTPTGGTPSGHTTTVTFKAKKK
jgi:uncharacterized repeat protein (TIGR02543 family)